MGHQLWLADRLRAEGLNVVEVAGWQTRGSSTMNPRGSVNHHTAGGAKGNIPSLNILINGRSGLPGPLCNVGLGRDNTAYVVAAGRANHAGSGGWRGISGNSSVLGLECENVGYADREPWRPDQAEAMGKVHAAFAKGAGFGSEMVCQHKEWTSRKPDAHTINGATFRGLVAQKLTVTQPNPPNPNPNPPQTSNDEDDEMIMIIDPAGGVHSLGGVFRHRLASSPEQANDSIQINTFFGGKLLDCRGHQNVWDHIARTTIDADSAETFLVRDPAGTIWSFSGVERHKVTGTPDQANSSTQINAFMGGKNVDAMSNQGLWDHLVRITTEV